MSIITSKLNGNELVIDDQIWKLNDESWGDFCEELTNLTELKTLEIKDQILWDWHGNLVRGGRAKLFTERIIALLIDILPNLKNLKKLSLFCCNIQLEGIWMPLCSLGGSGIDLEELNLVGNHVGSHEDGMEMNYGEFRLDRHYGALGVAYPNLKKISLGWSGGDPNCMIKVLSYLKLKKLEVLDWYDGLPDVTVDALELKQDFFKTYEKLSHIDFGYYDDEANVYYQDLSRSLDAHAWKELCSILQKFESLKKLNFNGVLVSEEGTKSLASLITSPGCNYSRENSCFCNDLDDGSMDHDDYASMAEHKENLIDNAFTQKLILHLLSARMVGRIQQENTSIKKLPSEMIRAVGETVCGKSVNKPPSI